jgi:glycerol-3-phosphate dehydrogenase
VLAAEAAFAVHEEMAINLIDIVHRRMMIGLGADQGASLSPTVAQLAAAELHWDGAETRRQLKLLSNYDQRLKPAFLNARLR